MDIDDSLAALQFFENRFQDGISEIHAIGIRKEHNAMETEDIERVGELLQ